MSINRLHGQGPTYLMQNIIFGIIMTFLLVPGSVFAASGTTGSVETLGATYIDSQSTELRASFYTYNQGTRLFFEYGPTQAFGRQTYAIPVLQEKADVGYQRAFYLTPNVLYYYRAVIEGTGGTVYGQTRTFYSGVQNDSAYAVQNSTNGNTGSIQNTNTNTNTTNTNTTSGSNTQIAGVGGALGNVGATQNQDGSIVGQNQIGAGGFFQRLFDAATRARPLQLSIVMNPEKPKAREIVEYIVTYTNDSVQSVGAGTLAIVLPDSVVYLSDNSGGKTTLAKVSGGQEISLATNPLSAKGSATITVMAIAGSGVAKAVPTAVASMSYANAQGAVQNIATNKAAKATPLIAAVANTKASSQSASAAESGTSSGGILPNTFFEWLIFLVVVTGVIVTVRRVMAVYQERKKRILEESQPATPVHA